MTEAKTAPELKTGLVMRQVFVWPACILVMGLHLYWGDDAYTPLSHIAAGLIGCVVLIATAYAPPRMLPAAPILLLYYYVAMARPTFSAPALKGVTGPIYLSSSSYEAALVGALLFSVTLLLSARLVQNWGMRFSAGIAARLDPPGAYTQGHTLVARAATAVSLVLFILVNLKASLVPVSLSLAIYLFASPVIPLGLLFWDAHQTQTAASRALFWTTVAFTAVLGMSNSTLGGGIVPGLIAASLVWTISGRVPVTLILVGTMVLLFLSPAKSRYRAQVWYQERDIGLQERFESWVEALTYTYSTSPDAAIDASVDATAYRTTTLPSVALIFETVPNVIPHAGPTKWIELLPITLVPRFFWTAKPSHTEVFNNDFTMKFGLQDKVGVTTTTLNLPSVGDGYWRLGWPGVLFEGFLLGSLVGLFQGATRRQSRALLILGVGFVISTQADKHVFYLLSSLPQYLFATGLILFVVRTVGLLLMDGRPSAEEPKPVERSEDGAPATL